MIYIYILFYHQAHSFMYTFEHNRNEEIMEEMKIEPTDEKLGRYKSNCLQHVTRMNKGMPKILLDQMDEDNLEGFLRDYQTWSKQVY